MAVPFGFSAGDFIAGVKLLKSAFDSLSDARGAKADYSELRQTLGALEKALDAAGQFTTPQHQAAVDDEVANCKECINKFLAGFKKFELLKTGRGRTGREDVRKFKEHLEAHVSALQLQLAVFQIGAEYQNRKLVEQTNAGVQDIASQMETSLKLQKDLAAGLKGANDAQSLCLANVQGSVESSSQVISTIPSKMDEIQEHLQRGLSPDMQHAMFQLLQDALADKESLQRRMDALIAQQESFKFHFIEFKQIVRVHQEIPSQVMLRRPVVLIDAFEENRLPFHLDFINSFEALSAVLEIRFKDKGCHALKKIQRQLFVMYEHSKQKQICMEGAWPGALKPGLVVEMSMLVAATPTVAKTRCPGCDHAQEEKAEEGDKLRCSNCPMVYRWSKLLTSLQTPSLAPGQNEVAGALFDFTESEDISVYCRIDMLERVSHSSDTTLLHVHNVGRGVIWFCTYCGDGPWNPRVVVLCTSCGVGQY
ncbi:hypothetical protein HBI42_143660 [Parastagonospora nodorum]|nr:hypothetical protein HBH75_004950 [Parastagonospora nodorum]KAH6252633.1 hypothetical protein HBI42_143660 [Parastagonospora nodorum]